MAATMQRVVDSDPEFGALKAEHGAALTPRVALYFLITLLAGIVTGLSVVSERYAIAVLAIGIAAALSALVHYLAGAVRVRIFDNGIERSGRFGVKRVPWSELQTYQLQLVDAAVAAGASGGLVGVLVASLVVRALDRQQVPNAVVLRGKDGTKITLAPNFKDYKRWIAELVENLTERLLPLAQQGYESGAELQFGKKFSVQRGVGITVTGLFGKKKVLALENAGSATLERTLLVIRRSDTNAVWQKVNINSIVNPGVLQQLIEAKGKPYVETLPMAWTN
jgi:hypothetical protein